MEYRGIKIGIETIYGFDYYSCTVNGLNFIELCEFKIMDRIDSVLGNPFSVKNILS